MPWGSDVQRNETPTGLALFPKDNLPPHETAACFLNVKRWTIMPSGGHFTALEEPAPLVDLFTGCEVALFMVPAVRYREAPNTVPPPSGRHLAALFRGGEKRSCDVQTKDQARCHPQSATLGG